MNPEQELKRLLGLVGQQGASDLHLVVGQPFNVGGELLMYPSDPKGSAGTLTAHHLH